MTKQIKLRNTYQVPAGKQVVVNTPSGQKKYLGGEFVPPEQLNKATVKDAPSKGENKSSENGQVGEAGGGWDEIANNFKMIDITNPNLVNQASYNIQQFVNTPINTSNKSVHPVSRFGAQLSIANLINSVPGFKALLDEIGVNIQIIHGPIEKEHLLGKNFIKIGELNFKEKTIKFWQHEEDLKDLLKSVAEFLSHKIGLLSINYLMSKITNAKQTAEGLQKELQKTSELLKKYVDSYLKKHKGKPPKAGSDENIDNVQQKVQELTMQFQSFMELNAILNNLVQITLKEGGIDNNVKKSLSEDASRGTQEQIAKILTHANLFSFRPNNTFDLGMQQLASSHPETLDGIRNLINFLNQTAQQQASPAEQETQEAAQ